MVYTGYGVTRALTASGLVQHPTSKGLIPGPQKVPIHVIHYAPFKRGIYGILRDIDQIQGSQQRSGVSGHLRIPIS